jgi:hypothetical protein
VVSDLLLVVLQTTFSQEVERSLTEDLLAAVVSWELLRQVYLEEESKESTVPAAAMDRAEEDYSEQLLAWPVVF